MNKKTLYLITFSLSIYNLNMYCMITRGLINRPINKKLILTSNLLNCNKKAPYLNNSFFNIRSYSSNKEYNDNNNNYNNQQNHNSNNKNYYEIRIDNLLIFLTGWYLSSRIMDLILPDNINLLSKFTNYMEKKYEEALLSLTDTQKEYLLKSYLDPHSKYIKSCFKPYSLSEERIIKIKKDGISRFFILYKNELRYIYSKLNKDQKKILYSLIDENQKIELFSCLYDTDKRDLFSSINDEDKTKLLSGIDYDQMRDTFSQLNKDQKIIFYSFLKENQKIELFSYLWDIDKKDLFLSINDEDKTKLLSGIDYDQKKKLFSSIIFSLNNKEAIRIFSFFSNEEKIKLFLDFDKYGKNHVLSSISSEQREELISLLNDKHS